MRNFLKFVATLIVTFLVMFAFRALVFTVYMVPSDGLRPMLKKGDRVLVNRWSYGLRAGGTSLFPYERIMKLPVLKNDVVVFNDPLDTIDSVSDKPVFIGRCKAVPGDTVWFNKRTPFVIPGRCNMVRVEKWNVRLICNTYMIHEHRNAKIFNDTLYVDGKETHCASFSRNYYWVESLGKNNIIDSRCFGLVPESYIIGRAIVILFAKDSRLPFYDGYDVNRIMLSIE
jgi:signal peptidase I